MWREGADQTTHRPFAELRDSLKATQRALAPYPTIIFKEHDKTTKKDRPPGGPFKSIRYLWSYARRNAEFAGRR
jgi:hypothetical protein